MLTAASIVSFATTLANSTTAAPHRAWQSVCTLIREILRSGKQGHKYMTSYEIIAGGNYDIVLVEECSDIKNKEQLRARERFHIEGNECVNKYIPGRTPKEHYVDNKEKIAAREAEYYAANKEQIRVKHSEYYAANKEQILVKQSEYKAAHKEKIAAQKAEYYAKNKEQITAKIAEYQAANKEKIAAREAEYRAANKDAERAWKAEKVTCPHCSSIVSRTCLPRHQRTAKCLAAQDSDL
jgi:hypothetical protein